MTYLWIKLGSCGQTLRVSSFINHIIAMFCGDDSSETTSGSDTMLRKFKMRPDLPWGDKLQTCVGRADGEILGDGVGASVGDGEGAGVGDSVGAFVGESVGVVVGCFVGLSVGSAVGALVGGTEGTPVGNPVGDDVGGAVVGLIVGASVGDVVGAEDVEISVEVEIGSHGFVRTIRERVDGTARIK